MGRRAGLALAAAAIAVGVWTVGPPQPKEASAGPYFGLMCSDVTDAHFGQLGDTITCFESLGGHSPRRHVNSWRLCVEGPDGSDSCRTGSSGCAWIDGHTPPSSGGNCGHSCHSVWRGYTGVPGASCSFVSHYDTPHVHVGLRLGTRTRPSCSTGQHRDGGSGSCHSHPKPACTADGTYTKISGTGHTTGTTAVCGPPPCRTGQHRDGGSGSCHSHPKPACTADGTYTKISGTGHTTGTTAVCAPTPCRTGQHRDGGSGSCHSHPKPACTADGTYTKISGNGHTTGTTAICRSNPPPCPSGQHRDGGSGSCHSHPKPACTADGTYTKISGNGHTTGTTAICRSNPPPCPSGQHRDGGSGSCHSHPKPACTADGTYTRISGNGHTTGTTAICGGTPDPIPDPDSACSTGLSLTEQDRVAFLADLSWVTLVDINPQGPQGERWPPHPDVPGGSEYLVVADSPVWTVIDSAALWSVLSLDGCVWEATDVEVLATQLLPWRSGDRLDIENAAAARPDAGFDTYLQRWDRLSATQRSEAQQYHIGGGVSHVCGFADAKDPALAKSRCWWELPWAGVWNWSIGACFEGVGAERTYEECAVLDHGVEWFLNIVDYTRQITLLADEPARE